MRAPWFTAGAGAVGTTVFFASVISAKGLSAVGRCRGPQLSKVLDEPQADCKPSGKQVGGLVHNFKKLSRKGLGNRLSVLIGHGIELDHQIAGRRHRPLDPPQ